MLGMDTDREWEKFGAGEPYFGVLSHKRYCRVNLTDKAKAYFFQSGREYLAMVLDNVAKHIDPRFVPQRALDFGCGVGRVTIPLARVAEQVVGIDVSESMLSEARENCRDQSVDNVVLLKSGNSMSSLEAKYDFIHSSLVFQHIPVKRGLRIFTELMAYLDDGGVCVVHFTYGKSFIRKCVSLVKGYVPLGGSFLNLMKGRGASAPQMQMNAYNLNELFHIIQRNDVNELYAQYTNHGGELGCRLYFQKAKKSSTSM